MFRSYEIFWRAIAGPTACPCATPGGDPTSEVVAAVLCSAGGQT